MRVRLVGLLASAIVLGAAAQAEAGQSPSGHRSTGKRIAWIAAGAGAGFVGGLFLGLHEFDDAINSDRKVWLSAISGAIGGAIAADFIAKDTAPVPRFQPMAPFSGNVPAEVPIRLGRRAAADAEVVSKIRALARDTARAHLDQAAVRASRPARQLTGTGR